MRFSAIHKLSSYLMVLTAVAALALGPELSLLAAALTLVGVGASWFVEPGRHNTERYAVVWNVATILFFCYLAVEVLRGESVILAGAHFLLFVLVNKLFNRRTSRDYLQAYVVSFLLLVVATTMNTGISYAICFAAYTLFATWTLILFHLRREMEENYLLKHADGAQSEKVEVERILNSRRIVGGAFLGGTSLLSLGVLGGAVAIFTLFPRIGFGLFVGHRRGGVLMAGFRERVELGHHGVVRDNPNVVLRVVLPGNKPPAAPLRWRGSVFDAYEHGVWSHGEDLIGRTQAVLPQGGLYVINEPVRPRLSSPAAIRSQLLRQEVYLEPLDAPVLFAADRPVAIDAGRATAGGLRTTIVPRRGPLGEIQSGARSAGAFYIAYSDVTPPSVAELRQSRPLPDLPGLNRRVSARLERFLRRPPSLPMAALARQIAGHRTSVYDRVLAVQQYLQRGFRYTLKLRRLDPQMDPVEEFLFVTREGHCEYFASAMALLLRHLDIHARTVNGFAGGEWNAYGKYLAVRQGDAHAWVEVLFSHSGWVTFDPTPTGQAPPVAPAGTLLRLRQMLDTVRMRWFRHVVEYDLRQQVSLWRGAQRLLSSRGESWLGRHRTLLLGGAGAAAVLALIVLVLRRRRRRTVTDGQPETSRRALAPAAQVYARALRLLARAGHAKPSGATPQEFAERLARESFGPAALLARFTRCYYQARFAGSDDRETEAARELATMLRELQQAVRTTR